MPFLTLHDADIDFFNRKLRRRTYTIKEALLTTRHVELMGKKELQLQSLTRDMRPTLFTLGQSIPMRRPTPPQTPTKVPVKYVDFVFSSDLVSNSLSTLGSTIMLSS